MGDYRFAAGDDHSPPTLWKHGTKRLEWVPTEKRYQVDGLTLADYESIQRQAQKVRIKSIETVAPLMAKFLEQKGVELMGGHRQHLRAKPRRRPSHLLQAESSGRSSIKQTSRKSAGHQSGVKCPSRGHKKPALAWQSQEKKTGNQGQQRTLG